MSLAGSVQAPARQTVTVILGSIQGMIVDTRSGQATDLAVRHHGLLGRARVVPLVHVTRVDTAGAHLDLDEANFAALDGFVDDRHHA